LGPIPKKKQGAEEELEESIESNFLYTWSSAAKQYIIEHASTQAAPTAQKHKFATQHMDGSVTSSQDRDMQQSGAPSIKPENGNGSITITITINANGHEPQHNQ